MLVLIMGGIYNVRRWDDIPSFVKIARRVKGILRFCLKDIKGCFVGVTGGRGL
jgi:hypothetical protein